jgi:hypothetical protein
MRYEIPGVLTNAHLNVQLALVLHNPSADCACVCTISIPFFVSKVRAAHFREQVLETIV